MALRPFTSDELDALEATIDAFFDEQLSMNPAVAEVVSGVEGGRRWIIRLLGTEKDTFSVWFTLDQRTLGYETFVMPAPEENAEAFYRHLLVRNHGLVGAAFAVGDEGATFLEGHLENDAINEDHLDRVLGSMFVYVEQFFRPALRIGFASRFDA